jgi:endonuclease/exonuclease/phosphatase (EEP) superfamily protein YafD
MRLERPTARAVVAIAVAAPWTLWAVIRLFGLERGHPLTAAMAFTPFVAATAWVPIGLAILLRRRAIIIVAGLAMLILVLAVAPRALHRPEAPLVAGRTLSVMTVNLRYGSGDAATVMALARAHRVDILSLQELTTGAVRRLDAAGAHDRFPYRVLDPHPGAQGSGLMSRYALHPLPTPRHRSRCRKRS